MSTGRCLHFTLGQMAIESLLFAWKSISKLTNPKRMTGLLRVSWFAL